MASKKTKGAGCEVLIHDLELVAFIYGQMAQTMRPMRDVLPEMIRYCMKSKGFKLKAVVPKALSDMELVFARRQKTDPSARPPSRLKLRRAATKRRLESYKKRAKEAAK